MVFYCRWEMEVGSKISKWTRALVLRDSMVDSYQMKLRTWASSDVFFPQILNLNSQSWGNQSIYWLDRVAVNMRIWFRVYVKTCRVLCSWNILHMLRLMYMFECGVIYFFCLIFAKVGSVHAENIVSVSVFASSQVSVRLFGWFRCRCLFLVVWHIVSCLVSCTGLW